MRKLGIYGFALAFCAVLFAVCAPLAALWPTLAWRNRVSLVAGRWWARACLRVAGIRVVLEEGREHLLHAPAIFTFNHSNMLDFFVNGVLARPGWLVFGKRELAAVPFVGWAWALGGHPLIKRQDRDHWGRLLARVEGRLARGWCTIVAPEGRRSGDGALLPFKKGAFHMALHTRAPIVPIVLLGVAPLLVRGTPMSGEVRVRVLPPIDTSGWTLEDLDRQVERVRGLYLDALGQARA